MILTLSPEIEKALTTAAARQGTTPEELAGAVLQEKYGGSQELPNTEIPNTEIPNTEIPNTEIPKEETPDERRARIHAIKGSMAYLGPSRILEDRAEDRRREEKHWQK